MAASIALANDRFKSRFSSWFWEAVALATVLHFLAFALWPDMSAAGISSGERAITTFDLPPDIEVPPPPAAVARPATPQVSEAVIDDDVTIGATTFADNPVALLPPPPATTSSGQAGRDLADAPRFTPTTVWPELKNPGAARAALERSYPPMLRDAGIGGSVTVWFFLDEAGQVVKKQLSRSSGYPPLDTAALKVAEVMQFSPAWNMDKKVPVWVEIEVVFTAK